MFYAQFRESLVKRNSVRLERCRFGAIFTDPSRQSGVNEISKKSIDNPEVAG